MKMSPGEIMAGLADKNRKLDAKNDEYIDLAEISAQKERDYQQALAKYTLKLRADGIQITILKDVARGDYVAGLKFEWMVAEAVTKTCLNAIKILTSQIDTYRSLLSWLKAEMQSQ